MTNYTFAIIPKVVEGNPFFNDVKVGCETFASDIARSEPGVTVTCLWTGATSSMAADQAQVLRDLVFNSSMRIDGISVSVLDETVVGEAVDDIINRTDTPVITFDSDAPNSGRLTFVGTNNTAMGQELGKVLVQLDPMGGLYGIITSDGPNVEKRVLGLKQSLARTNWALLPNGTLNCHENTTLALQLMQQLATPSDPSLHVKAIVSVGGWPMFSSNISLWENFFKAYNRTAVVADGIPEQITLYQRGYAPGLVAQEPFQMGYHSAEILYNIATNKTTRLNVTNSSTLGTHMLEMLRVPLNLPPVHFNYNYIGNSQILGYLCFSIVGVLSIAAIVWTYLHRTKSVVKASQPIFLMMIPLGTLIMSSAMIPLGFDDGSFSLKVAGGACIATAWLIPMGFTVTFSALFSKLWRLNKIFQGARSFKRIKVTEKDVIVPFILLLAANVLVLIVWTAYPHQFVRKEKPGTDLWNRPIASTGSCYAEDSSVGFLVTLVVLNATVVILANIQAYKARNIQTEYSESKYINIIMISMLQTLVLGVPIMVLARGSPVVQYYIIVLILFMICMAILYFIFVPKVLALRERLSAKKSDVRAAESIPNKGAVTSHQGHNNSATNTTLNRQAPLLDPEDPTQNHNHWGSSRLARLQASGINLIKKPTPNPRSKSQEEQDGPGLNASTGEVITPLRMEAIAEHGSITEALVITQSSDGERRNESLLSEADSEGLRVQKVSIEQINMESVVSDSESEGLRAYQVDKKGKLIK